MIEQVTAWQCTCSNCGTGYNIEGGKEAMLWKDKDCLMFWLREDEEWKELDKKWYCGDCWTIDDNDNYVVKNRYP